MEKTSFKVALPGREEIGLEFELNELGEIQSSRLWGIGGPQLLDLLVLWRPKVSGALMDLAVPTENHLEAMLLRELILKAKSQWQPNLHSGSVCHCRGISQACIDSAILLGAHSVSQVRAVTSASSACGTCAPTVQELIDFRSLNFGQDKKANPATQDPLEPNESAPAKKAS